MADEAEDIDGEEDGEEAPKKKLGLMKLGLFIGLPAVIVILGAVAAFLLLSGGGDDDHVVAEGEYGEEHGEEAAGYAESHAEAMLYPFTDEYETSFMVNIQSTGGRSPLLKLELMVEFTDPAVQDALDSRYERITDQFVTFLRELRVEDLSGSDGSYRLKAELLRRINLAIAPLEADDVLIQTMLLQ